MSKRVNNKIYTTHTGVNSRDGFAIDGTRFIDEDGDLVVKSVSVGFGGTATEIINSTGDLTVATGPTGPTGADFPADGGTGEILYYTGTAEAWLAGGTADQFLGWNATSGVPEWKDLPA